MQSVVMLLVVVMVQPVWAAERTRRIWIVPFDNPGADTALAHLEQVLPALLAVVVSQSEQHAVIDRRHLEQVLAEQSLTLEGLTAPHIRHRVGRLLGATLMITGSFVRQGQDLLLTARAIEVESGMVVATAASDGPADRLGDVVGELYRRLARHLGRRLPAPGPGQIDPAPLANLHFMRGLGYYYSAQYNQALAEFMQAAREKTLAGVARLWLVDAYLAQDAYEHAYLELRRLQDEGAGNLRPAELAARMRACEQHLNPEEMAIIRELAARRTPAAR